MNAPVRFSRFNVVGAVGVGLQLGLVHLLTSTLGIHAIVASVVAVVAVVLHNFAWHWHWTWSDRALTDDQRASTLARFVVLNGAVSIVGGAMVVAGLVGEHGVSPVAANVVAIALCGIVNYQLADKVVFRTRTRSSSIGRCYH